MKVSKRQLLIFLYLLKALSLANSEHKLPDIVFKIDGGFQYLEEKLEEEFYTRSNLRQNTYGKLTLAIGAYHLDDDETVGKFVYTARPRAKFYLGKNNKSNAYLGGSFYIGVVEAGIFYDTKQGECIFPLLIKPDMCIYFSDCFGLNISLHIGYIFSNNSKNILDSKKYEFGVELGLSFNPTRKYRNNIIRKREQEAAEIEAARIAEERRIEEERLEKEAKIKAEEERIRAEQEAKIAEEKLQKEKRFSKIRSSFKKYDGIDGFDGFAWGTDFETVAAITMIENSLQKHDEFVYSLQSNSFETENFSRCKRYLFYELPDGSLELFSGEIDYNFGLMPSSQKEFDDKITPFREALWSTLAKEYKFSVKSVKFSRRNNDSKNSLLADSSATPLKDVKISEQTTIGTTGVKTKDNFTSATMDYLTGSLFGPLGSFIDTEINYYKEVVSIVNTNVVNQIQKRQEEAKRTKYINSLGF